MSEPSVHPLRAWRVQRRLTQSKLGELVGLAASQISMIESGQRGTSVEVAAKIAEIAGDDVPISSLTRREATQ